MKLFVESHTIIKNKSGVGWFAHGLVKGAQAELGPKDSIHLLTHPQEPHNTDDLLKDWRTFDHPIDWLPAQFYHALKFRNKLPPVDLLYGRGVYVFPNFIRWPLARSSSVIVVHDLSMFDMPEFSYPKNVEFMTRHLSTSVKRADLIIAVSKSTKQALCERFGVDPAKVIVTHLAAADDLYKRTEAEVAAAKAKYGIFGKYIFFVSNLEPRKNVDGIVRAYRALPRKLREEYSLVLSGGRAWRDDSIQAAINDARLAGERVITTGYIDIEDKPALISGAAVFLYPSHYEGFGIPVVEAMNCGTPVITANNTSLPEVGGDAVLYVDSRSDEQLTDALKSLLEDEKLRERYAAKGLKQAEQFSWPRTAHAVLEGIKSHGLG